MSKNKCWGKCIVTCGSHIEMGQTINYGQQIHLCKKTRDMVKTFGLAFSSGEIIS
jgi:hypothetical protein